MWLDTNTALVAVRESLEAFLIVGILAGIVRKSGNPGARRYIVWGGLAGVLASVLLGVLANGLAATLYGKYGPLFEAATSLLAVAILTYMVAWMYQHTREMMGTLHTKSKAALGANRPVVLAGLAFIAILREGAETVLFTASRLPLDGPFVTAVSIAVGVAVSAVIAALVFGGVVRLSIERFMAVTGAFLVVVAAGMLVYGLHELAETSLGASLRSLPVLFDLRAVLPHNGMPSDPEINTAREAIGAFLAGAVGWRANPTILEAGAWLAYVVGMTVWLRRRKHHRAA